jgi:hypothetical protein
MKVYLGKQREDAAGDVTATHGTVLQLVRRVHNKGHKVMNNYFSTLCLADDLHNRRIGSYGTVRHNRKEMPSNFGSKHLKLKKGDIVSKMRDNLTAVFRSGKREVYMDSNIHPSPANHNFLDQYGCAIKRHTAEQYNTYEVLLTKVTACQTAVAYGVVHGNGRKSCSSTFLISLHSTRSCFTSPVGGVGLSHKHFRTQLIRKRVHNVDMTTTRLHRGRSSSSARLLSVLKHKNSITGLSTELKGGLSCVA